MTHYHGGLTFCVFDVKMNAGRFFYIFFYIGEAAAATSGDVYFGENIMPTKTDHARSMSATHTYFDTIPEELRWLYPATLGIWEMAPGDITREMVMLLKSGGKAIVTPDQGRLHRDDGR